MTAFELELAGVIVSAIDLDQPPATIDPDTALYGDALGIDSIDILEIAVVVAARYGIELSAETVGNEQIFASLRTLARHVAANRTR